MTPLAACTYFILLAISCCTAVQAQSFTITQHNNNQTMQPCRDVIAFVYNKLGIQYELKPYPGRRALLLANEGKSDAELCRIPAVAEKYENLIKVSPPLMYIDIVAVSAKPAIIIEKAEDIRAYKVVSIVGMKAAEYYFKDFPIIYVSTAETALALVADHRAEVAILAYRDVPEGQNLKIHSPPLYSHPMHHYIHKKHKALLEKMQLAIKEAKALQLADVP